MKILHIINNGLTELPKKIIEAQSKDNEVKVIKLSQKKKSYEDIIDDIFSYDRVVSW